MLVDNKVGPFLTKYNTLIKYIPENIHNSAKTKIFGMIEDLSKEIQKNIYKPFSEEQNYIQNKLIELLYNTKEKLIDRKCGWILWFISMTLTLRFAKFICYRVLSCKRNDNKKVDNFF